VAGLDLIEGHRRTLGNSNIGAGASYTGQAFVEGAQATGQAIGRRAAGPPRH
jgi:hypothetical protein